MTGESVYFKQNVVAEPLFNLWYAWPYLIPPASAAMYVANSHLKIMKSFVANPQVHVAALKNPSMLGGPFINYEAGRAGEINKLIEKTVGEQSGLLELADAIRSLDEMLQREATGGSLEPLYKKVPEKLRGYVELTYDTNNHPSVRFIEGLLYKSRYYDTAAQSVALFADEGEHRPFALSSPKLFGERDLHLRVPFADGRLDELFRMKSEARPFAQIRELLGVDAGAGAELFSSFFTEEAPPPPPRFTGDGVRVRYFGHACVLIETSEVSILCDPLVSYRCGYDDERYTYADLPAQIDYALITHGHQDHCQFETLLQLRHKIRNVVVPRSSGGSLADPSLKLILRNLGFASVHEIDELESIDVGGGSVTGLPFLGEHGDLGIRTKTAYLISLKGRTILCAADSNNVEPRLYEHLREAAGEVDVVFLGMECDGAPLSWLYGPLLTRPLARKLDQSRRFDGSDREKGMSLIHSLNPKQVYVYAMGQEPWLVYLTSIQYTDESRPIVESNGLVEQCRAEGLISERLFRRKEILLARGGG
jgi:L-ascorbate metabolism protein UlaG (beta-lactamase superfamily)